MENRETAKQEEMQEYVNKHAVFFAQAIVSYAENDGMYLPAEKYDSLMLLQQNIRNSHLVTPYEVLELSKLVGEDIAMQIIDVAKNRAVIDRTLKNMAEAGTKLDLEE